MNKDNVIVSINSIDDIKLITSDTKYINIAIDNDNDDVISYFISHGQDFYYSDMLDNKKDFIYIDYDTFKLAENKIREIIRNVPKNLNMIEKIRYLYISLGRKISLDINLMENKNKDISFGNVVFSNNIWGALVKEKVTDKACAKLFLYLCSRVQIKSELVSVNINGNIANKVYLDDSSFLLVDLFNDIHNIWGRFVTCHFDNYNDNIDIDKKIGYINDNYSNYYLESVFKNMGEMKGNILYKILSVVERVVDLSIFKPLELSNLLKEIFKKYYANYEIKINNFYMSDGMIKNHFMIVSYRDEIYSYNYYQNCFVLINLKDIKDNLQNNIIELYDNEDFNWRKEVEVL